MPYAVICEKTAGRISTVKQQETDDSDVLVEKYRAQQDIDCRRVEDELKVPSKKAEAPYGVIVGDLYGYITDVNNAVLKMFGTTDKTEFVGKHVLNFTAKTDKPRATEESLRSLQTGQGRTAVYHVVRKNGEEFPVEVTVDLIRDKKWSSDRFCRYYS